MEFDPLLDVSEELELDTVFDEEKLEEAAAKGRGSGIRTESSLAPPRRAVSAVQLLSLTIKGFNLCQHKLVTAWEYKK